MTDNTATQSRWLRVMADYSATGLWLQHGGEVSASTLGLSDALQARHTQWCNWFEDSWEYSEHPNPKTPPFDYAGFAQEGLALAKAIKAELPDWTIVYFDEHIWQQRQSGAVTGDVEYDVTL